MRQQADAGSASGFGIASSANATVVGAVSEIRRALGGPYQHIIVYFSPNYPADELAIALGEAFGETPVSGCSTAGNIGPSGMMETGLLAIAIPNDGFRVHAAAIGHVASPGVERAADMVRKLRARLGYPIGTPLRDRVFGVLLVDGLSAAEEMLVAAIQWAFEDMQLVGGSAGDGLEFKKSFVIHNNAVVPNGAVLFLIESDFPFRIFKSQNFEPTPIKLVVTQADSANRIVYELNAEKAALEYANAIGLMPGDLGPFSFASYPLVVRVGGDYYCRSIRNMNADGSLSFFCAIDEGLVFTVARPTDMIASTERALARLDEELGGVRAIWGFDCVLRRLDAETRQIRRPMEELYKKYGVVGFHTYGEQLNAMHLNQTLTGVAFGRRRIVR